MSGSFSMISQFKCFRHPTKKVEAICTEPFCNGYRFFCVQCFFENSSHFISHKQSIHEISQVVDQHQSSSLKSSTVQEFQQGLQRVKAQVKEYEQVIKSKHANYLSVIEAVEVEFQRAKAGLVREVEEYLSNLVQKQHAHFAYLENKMKVQIRDSSLTDWMSTNRNNEAELTAFFENIIKSPAQTSKDFSQELNAYTLSFRRNIQELDAQQNHKMLAFFSQELASTLKNKFVELKQLLVMTAEDLPLRQPSTPLTNQPQQQPTDTPMGTSIPFNQPAKFHFNNNNNNNNNMNHLNMSTTGEDFKFRNYRSVESSIVKSASHMLMHQEHNNNSSMINQQQQQHNHNQQQHNFSHTDFEEETMNTTTTYNNNNNNNTTLNNSNINNNIGSVALVNKPNQPSNNHASRPEKSPLHTGGICAMIAFQENTSKKIIATGSVDTTIKFWQLESASFDYIKTLRGHTAPVYALYRIEKENNIFLASASSNGELKIWNPILQGKELLASFSDHHDAILYIHLADDFLITGSMDKTVKIWNLDELFCSQTLNQDEAVTGLCCVQRDDSTKSLVSACGDGFRIWNQKKPGEYKLKSYNNKAHKKGVTCVATIALNGVDIATAGRDGLIKLWNLDKGVCVNQLTGHTDSVYQLFTPIKHNSNTSKRDLLYSCSTDGSIRVWNPPDQLATYENGHKYALQQQHPQPGQCIVFEQHNFILSASNDSNIIKIITIA